MLLRTEPIALGACGSHWQGEKSTARHEIQDGVMVGVA